jgi:hypothetical protein
MSNLHRAKLLYSDQVRKPLEKPLEGFFLWRNVTDLEQKLIEKLVQHAEKTASDDEKRELRETLLAMKLLERIPRNTPPAIWQDTRFWTFAFAILALIAALFGVQIPKEILTGGK